MPPAEAPSATVARVLRQEGLVLDTAGKRAWILTPGKPSDPRAVFLSNYWPVVAIVLERYQPAAIAGLAAICLHLEDFSLPEDLPVYHGASRSEYPLTLYPGFRLRLRPRAVASKNGIVTAPGNTPIPVQSPADLLTTLDEGEVSGGIETVSAWLRHLVIRTPDLEMAVDANPRPVILKRLAGIAAQLHNEPLARQLEQLVRRISSRLTTPSRTGVGTRIAVPPVLQDAGPRKRIVLARRTGGASCAPGVAVSAHCRRGGRAASEVQMVLPAIQCRAEQGVRCLPQHYHGGLPDHARNIGCNRAR